jgi:parvulin-like peptidyl-prolyl isomerase
VSSVWESPAVPQGQTRAIPIEPATEVPTSQEVEAESFDPIAIVNGKPIDRRRLVDMVFRSYAMPLFEQVVLLELAKQRAASEGVVVTEEDVQAEYRIALKQIGSPLPTTQEDTFEPIRAEQLLNEFLTSKNVPREQYMLSVERNAYLRKVVEKELVVPVEEVQRGFELYYGPRAQVRHIQVANAGEAAKVRKAMAEGMSFEDAAKNFSLNSTTGKNGGLLEPMAKGDPDLPSLLVETAFSLEPGQVSPVVLIDRWYHLLKLERFFPATEVDFVDVEHHVRERVRDRMIMDRRNALARDLLDQANIWFSDGELEKVFREKHPAKGVRPR